jgi:hypothetical protein
VLILDNADTRTRWLPDALATASTGGVLQRRKLYTDSESVILRARAWIIVTTANPTFAADAGLSDRLLVVRMDRRQGQTEDARLTDEIRSNRDGMLSHIAMTLRSALADQGPVPGGLNARHPDFGAFAVRVGRALGREAEAIAALKAAEADKSAFCLENDQVATALLGFVRGSASFTGPAAELLDKLRAIDPDLFKISAKSLGRRLGALWPHIQAVLPSARKEQDRKGFTVFTFSTP